MFFAVIHCRGDLSPVMKYCVYYLHTNLTSEAFEKIKSLSILNDYYEQACATLIEYYENQPRIVGSHIAKIFSARSIKSDISSEIKRIAREI